MGIQKNKGRWTYEEHEAFLRGIRLHKRNWEAVASVVPTRTVLQIRTHSQKYFAKIERGEVFPDQPYPSQYDIEAGQAGALAGAYLYGLPELEPEEQPRQQQQQRQQRQQRQTGKGGGTTSSGTTNGMASDMFMDQSGYGGGNEPGRRYPGLLIGIEKQRVAAAAAAGHGHTGPVNTKNGCASFIMLPPVASWSFSACGGHLQSGSSGGGCCGESPGSLFFPPSSDGGVDACGYGFGSSSGFAGVASGGPSTRARGTPVCRLGSGNGALTPPTPTLGVTTMPSAAPSSPSSSSS